MEMDNTMTRSEMIQWNKALIENTRTIEDFMSIQGNPDIYHYDVGFVVKATDKSYVIKYDKKYLNPINKRVDKKDERTIYEVLWLLKKELTNALDDRVKKTFSEDRDERLEVENYGLYQRGRNYVDLGD
jgi:hypothetical protein